MGNMQAIGLASRDAPGSFKRKQEQFGVIQPNIVARESRNVVSEIVQRIRLVSDPECARERENLLSRGKTADTVLRDDRGC